MLQSKIIWLANCSIPVMWVGSDAGIYSPKSAQIQCSQQTFHSSMPAPRPQHRTYSNFCRHATWDRKGSLKVTKRIFQNSMPPAFLTNTPSTAFLFKPLMRKVCRPSGCLSTSRFNMARESRSVIWCSVVSGGDASVTQRTRFCS